MSESEKKARRRIRRFIETGEPQARVRQLSEKMYEYRVKHHIESILFKKDILGRLRKITP